MRQNEMIRLARRFDELRSQSIAKTLVRGLDKIWVYAYAPYVRRDRNGRTFELLGRRLNYFTHQYNATWRNERAVEIAIATDFLRKCRKADVLELGNVLSYYVDFEHDIIDKYEQSPGVLNVDFMDFDPVTEYDAFISISTLEHIGWDETPREPEKAERAIMRIGNLVRHRENVLVTFPLGYNETLDKLVERRALPFNSSLCLIRVNKKNEWREATVEEALRSYYEARFPAANAIFVGIGLA